MEKKNRKFILKSRHSHSSLGTTSIVPMKICDRKKKCCFIDFFYEPFHSFSPYITYDFNLACGTKKKKEKKRRKTTEMFNRDSHTHHFQLAKPVWYMRRHFEGISIEKSNGKVHGTRFGPHLTQNSDIFVRHAQSHKFIIRSIQNTRLANRQKIVFAPCRIRNKRNKIWLNSIATMAVATVARTGLAATRTVRF